MTRRKPLLLAAMALLLLWWLAHRLGLGAELLRLASGPWPPLALQPCGPYGPAAPLARSALTAWALCRARWRAASRRTSAVHPVSRSEEHPAQ
jgi:hypothetical protein